MESFKFLPHTADVRLSLEADHIQGIFRQAVLGLSAYLRGKACEEDTEYRVKRTIETNAPEVTSLLVDFLSDVLLVSQIEYLIFCAVEFEIITNNQVLAHLRGIKVDEFAEDIKAVTYHEAEVVKLTDQHWRATIIFDL